MVDYWVYTFNGAQSCGRQGHVLSEVVSVHDVHIDVNRIVSRRWWKRWRRWRRRWRPRHVTAFSHLLLLRMHGMVRRIQRPMPTGLPARSLQRLHHLVFFFLIFVSLPYLLYVWIESSWLNRIKCQWTRWGGNPGEGEGEGGSKGEEGEEGEGRRGGARREVGGR